MRNLLGIFLALHGGLWWFGCLLASFVLGMLASFAGTLDQASNLWKLLALPALALALAMGDGMVVFGLLLIGSDKPHLIAAREPAFPASSPVVGFLLRGTRVAGLLLAVVFACELISRLIIQSGRPTTTGLGSVAWPFGLGILNLFASIASGHVLSRIHPDPPLADPPKS